jgi:hypothetical protein
VDQDRPVDLEQAFIVLIEPLDDGLLKFRLGRQQFAVDLQRFISFRDGPNVRLSFDAAWLEYERGPWSYIAFVSRPVQDRDFRSFDDYSNNQIHFRWLSRGTQGHGIRCRICVLRSLYARWRQVSDRQRQ